MSRSRQGWRQKGLAAVLSGAIFLPLIQGAVREYMPEGLLGLVGREQPIVSTTERSAARAGTLESILTASSEAGTLSPELAFKTATSLAHLSHEDVDAYERAGARMGIPAAMLATISILESEGGRILTPSAYSPDDKDAPRGHHHVKPGDLHSVLEQAGDARRYFRKELSERWPQFTERRWDTIREYESLVPSAERERFEAAFITPSGARRMLALASIIPEDLGTLDLDDAYMSALAAGSMLAYGAAYLASHDLEVSPESLLLPYVAGQKNAHEALVSQPHLSVAERARTIGPRSAWYVQEGSALYGHLSEYNSLREAHEHALRIVDLAQRAPEANEETVGLLYAMIHKNPQVYDWIAHQLEPTENGRRDINRVAEQYANRLLASR